MMEMKKLVKKALMGTMAGVMAVSAPLAVFAAEEKTEPETAVEKSEKEVMDDVEEMADEAMDEEVDWDAVMDELYTELEAMGLGDVLTGEDNQEEDELMAQMQEYADFICALTQDAEVRSAVIREVMDYFEVDLPEEEKQEFADALANATWEDWQEAGNAFVEFLGSDEFQQFVDQVEAEIEQELEAQKEESAKQIEEALNELGQALIDVSVDDIMAFLS